MIEAGGKDRSPNIKIPAAFPNQFHTKLDWDFTTEPEPHVDNRRLYIPRGKSLGGSSSMNAMLYVRGRPLDYDGWAAQGAPDGVTPTCCRTSGGPRTTSAARRSSTAPAARCRSASSAHRGRSDRALLEACAAAGIPRVADYNGPEQDGASMFQVTQRHGRRWSSADAFLRPVLHRPNLEVRTKATVLGVELEGDRAVGVRLGRVRGGGELVRAEREVVLCAGAIGSPQLLLLSGIGPADELRQVGVPVRHHLPGVGRNLQDHPFVTILWEVSDQRDAVRSR